ncbi:MAG: GtrA family protein [Pseudoxanthomonas sp.]
MGQLFRYILVGLFNTALGFAVIFSCMYLLKMSPAASNIAGYLFGFVVSYFLNKFFTFKTPTRSRSEALRFLVVFIAAYLANFGMLLLCIDVLHMHAAVSQVVAGAIYVGASFFLNKHYVFKHPA